MSYRKDMEPRDIALLTLSAACAAGIFLTQRLKPKRPRFPRR